MTNEKNSVIMAPANPVQTVAPEKEETEMLSVFSGYCERGCVRVIFSF